MIDSAVTDLPHPLSPTIPSVSPRPSASDTPSTALTTPSRVWKCVRSSLTASTGTACSLGRDACYGAHHIRRASCGSSMSRNPSPTRLIASTVTARNRPGSSTIDGFSWK